MRRLRPDQVISVLEDVVRRDPQFAEAWARIAIELSLLGPRSGVGDWLARARHAAEQAIALDEHLPSAYSALGFVHQMEWDFGQADQNYRRAVQLGPNDIRAHIGYAIFLRNSLGRFDESVGWSQRSVEMDPLGLTSRRHHADVLLVARYYERALRAIDRLPIPDREMEIRMYWALDRHEAWFERFLPRATRSGGDSEAIKAMWGKGGQVMLAKGILQRIVPERAGIRTMVIQSAGAGDIEGALDWLERGVIARDASISNIRSHFFTIRCARILVIRMRSSKLDTPTGSNSPPSSRIPVVRSPGWRDLPRASRGSGRR